MVGGVGVCVHFCVNILCVIRFFCERGPRRTPGLQLPSRALAAQRPRGPLFALWVWALAQVSCVTIYTATVYLQSSADDIDINHAVVAAAAAPTWRTAAEAAAPEDIAAAAPAPPQRWYFKCLPASLQR